MEKIYFLLMILLGSIVSNAQYFNPGTQAQGQLENKNYTVDYSTGMFYYSVPLFTVSTGGFNLPVSLSYAARGRKINDYTPGIVGFNWTLLHGGVITRSIRSNATYEEEQEADFYTLSLNGQTHCFIKRGDEFEFLEKTNVRLRHEANDIWRVTDGNGITYIFGAKEFTRNAGYGEDFASSNVTINEFVSAWYLTEVQVPNADNIYLEYTPSYKPKIASQLDSTIMGDGHYAYYVYGQDMLYFSFDEAGALAQAESYVQLALQQVYNSYFDKMIDIRFQHMRLIADGFYYCVDPELGLDVDKYRNLIENFEREYANKREILLGLQATIMGVMIDVSGVPWVSQSMINVINSYMEFIDMNVDKNQYQHYLAQSYLRSAKEVLGRAVRTTNYYQDKGQYVFSNYTVYTPHLKKIHCKGQEFLFDYTRAGEYLFLEKIRAYDIKSAKSGEINITVDSNVFAMGGGLKSLVWKGKDGKAYQSMTFDYHAVSGGYVRESDDWGYASYEQYYDDTICEQICNKRFLRFPVDDVNCKQGCLKTIHLSTGGSIDIDYEANRCNTNGSSSLFGGIRLKQITVKDEVGEADTIRYSYPNGGYLVYDDFYNWQCLEYPNFSDHVFWNKVKYKGNAYINTGNNGLFYDYVVEKLVGKGYNTYLFCVPRSSKYQIDNTYPFWLCGVLLAKASYNESGNLVNLQKNRYYVDLSVCETNVTKTDWFTQTGASFLFGKKIDQKRISEYYMDPVKAREFYLKGAKSGNLFVDSRDGYGAYYDPVEIFDYNVASRFGYPKYETSYKLYYGGKILPELQVNYSFFDDKSSAPSYQHLVGPLPSGATKESQVNYEYDNGLQLSSTRVIQTLSNGDQLIKRVRTPLDFTTGFDPVVRHMIDSNIVTPTLKEQSVLKKAGSEDYILLSEQVIIYVDTVNSMGQVCFLPHQTFTYSAGQAGISSTSLLNLDNKYCSLSGVSYRKLNQITHIEQEGKFFPMKTETSGKPIVTLYDPTMGVSYLSCQDENENQFGGIAFNPWEDVSGKMIGNIQLQRENYELLERFIENYGYPTSVSDNFENYRDNGNLKKILQFIHCILDKSDFEEIKTLQQTIISGNMISEFMDSVENNAIYVFWFPNPYAAEDFEAFPDALEFFTLMTEQEYNFMFQLRESGLSLSATLGQVVVRPGNMQRKYKLITILKPTVEVFSINYKVTRVNGESSHVLPGVTVTPGKWQIVASGIDVSGIQDVVSIKVDVPLQESGIKMVLLVPADAIFEASSFNPDGTLFCKFDQNGQMERYEYDAVGRVIKTFDRNGNLLKESEYNVVNH